MIKTYQFYDKKQKMIKTYQFYDKKQKNKNKKKCQKSI